MPIVSTSGGRVTVIAVYFISMPLNQQEIQVNTKRKKCSRQKKKKSQVKINKIFRVKL